MTSKKWISQRKLGVHDIKQVVKRIGHEIEENTELAEHETSTKHAKSTTLVLT